MCIRDRHESAASETGLHPRRTPIGPLCSVARIFRDLRKRVWPAPDRENLMTTKKATATPDAAEKTAQTPVETAAVPAIVERTFADFNVHPDIVASLADAGIIHPFPIQAMTLEVALAGHDIIGQAKTGTGKTLGFGIPMIQRVISPKDEAFATLATAGKPQALAVAPTRELAVQVSGDLAKAGKARGVRRHDLRLERASAVDRDDTYA